MSPKLPCDVTVPLELSQRWLLGGSQVSAEFKECVHGSNLGGEAGAGRALHIGNRLSEGMATGAVWLCVR